MYGGGTNNDNDSRDTTDQGEPWPPVQLAKNWRGV
jgi:hypothetical protein